ncbi:hypothetical protein AZ78_0488 [Lysobacter capsici AZ78]|uniref:Uncharacterized protein n=1 Tax=Lysobacter capsici AZ78 TaxID=1444315 RepID=A0A108U5I5_9GAMM|nr:hypothetical protein AZ78_0488 [Lysobacter capsici AZ78]
MRAERHHAANLRGPACTWLRFGVCEAGRECARSRSRSPIPMRREVSL